MEGPDVPRRMYVMLKNQLKEAESAKRKLQQQNAELEQHHIVLNEEIQQTVATLRQQNIERNQQMQNQQQRIAELEDQNRMLNNELTQRMEENNQGMLDSNQPWIQIDHDITEKSPSFSQSFQFVASNTHSVDQQSVATIDDASVLDSNSDDKVLTLLFFGLIGAIAAGAMFCLRHRSKLL